MISIRKSVNELERADHLRQLSRDGYISAIRAVAEYAVELDPVQLAEFRHNLNKIREQLEGAAQSAEFDGVQASLRGELRLYRDRAAEWLERMARELQASAMAMQSLAGSLSSNGDDHEARLNAGLRSLASVQQSNDITYIKQVTKDAATSIKDSWEQLRRANQVVTTQLHDEILSLHREIDGERRALFTDAASGAWTREKMNLRIEDNLSRDDAFCVIMATATNLKRLSTSYSQAVIDAALKAAVKRIHGIVGRDAMIGRWNGDQFAVLLEVSPEHAMASSSEIAKDLTSPFSIQENGVARSITFRVTTSVAGRPLAGDAAHFREKLAMLDIARRA